MKAVLYLCEAFDWFYDTTGVMRNVCGRISLQRISQVAKETTVLKSFNFEQRTRLLSVNVIPSTAWQLLHGDSSATGFFNLSLMYQSIEVCIYVLNRIRHNLVSVYFGDKASFFKILIC